MLEQVGVVRRIVTSDEHARFELAEDLTGHHHHLVCGSCGRVEDFTVSEQLERSLETALARVANGTGFDVDHHRLDLRRHVQRLPMKAGVLRFSYGIMGSGKSAVALQVHHNLVRRGLVGVLCTLFDRDGTHVSSRLGVSHPATEVTPDVDLLAMARAVAESDGRLDFLVCDEVQFYAEEQIDQLAAVVDELGADVFAYGLLTDFRGRLFEGTRRMLELADEHVPLGVEARCWCGRRATRNARIVNGTMTLEGETVVIGDTTVDPAEPLFGDTVSYELLCRRHYVAGEIGYAPASRPASAAW